MGKAIAILSGKGGVGKTTITANLGVSLAKDYNKKTLVIDANTTSSGLGFHLGQHNFGVTLQDVLKKRMDLEMAVYSHPSKLFVIPSSIGIKDIDAEPEGIKEIVKAMKPYMDIIILDGAPTLGIETRTVIDSADEIIIVTNLDTPSIMEAGRMEKYLKSKKKKIKGIVINMVKKYDKEIVTKISKTLTSPIIGAVSNDSYVQESIELGVPLIHLYPHSNASLDIKELISNIIGEEFPKKYGLFSRLFFLMRSFAGKVHNYF